MIVFNDNRHRLAIKIITLLLFRHYVPYSSYAEYRHIRSYIDSLETYLPALFSHVLSVLDP
jgi:hypothetical protein